MNGIKKQEHEDKDPENYEEWEDFDDTFQEDDYEELDFDDWNDFEPPYEPLHEDD